MIVFISKGLRSSIQRELDCFYKEVIGSDFNIRRLTKSAFTQARTKLKAEAFVELNDNVVQTFYDEAPYLVWNQMRVLAVDGSTLSLPSHPSIPKEFGERKYGPGADSPQTLANCSFLYDPLNLITVDAQIASTYTGERQLLLSHLQKIKQGDLLLLDRGYPSLAILHLLSAKKIDFCIRMKKDWWLDVQKFNDSDYQEALVTFKLPKKDYHLLAQYPEVSSVKCRLIKIPLPNGETEILCTSLLDSNKYSIELMAELYHLRWGVEEGYKLFKARMEIERFSGKTALAVRQDFYAKVFMMSLCATLAFPIEAKVREESKKDRVHERKINRTSALSMLRSITVQLLFRRIGKAALKAFDLIVSKTLEIIRLGRHFPRKKMKKRKHYMNYKPL